MQHNICNSNDLCSCIIRITGRDIHRRKWFSTGYHIISSGFSIFSCSGILYINDSNEICILCSADIIIPFLNKCSSTEYDNVYNNNNNNNNHNINFADSETRLSALFSNRLISSKSNNNNNNNKSDIYTEKWYNCSLIRLGSIDSVDSIISDLLDKSNDFHLGWATNSELNNLIDFNDNENHNINKSYLDSNRKLNSNTNNQLYYSNGYKRRAGLIAVLKLNNDDVDKINDLSASIGRIEFGCSNKVYRGFPVNVMSSPYGLLSPLVFQNSLTTGVIANTILINNENDCGSTNNSYSKYSKYGLLLTDARCLAGSEGGGVFNNMGELIGLVTIPLKHNNANSPVHLNSVIPINLIVQWLNSDKRTEVNRAIHFKQSKSTNFNNNLSPSYSSGKDKNDNNKNSNNIFQNPNPNHQIYNRLSHYFNHLHPTINHDTEDNRNLIFHSRVKNSLRHLVVCTISSSWASGIILSHNGFIITNAHLFRPYINKDNGNNHIFHKCRVRIQNHNYTHSNYKFQHRYQKQQLQKEWFDAKLIYICNNAWDIAVLKIDFSVDSNSNNGEYNLIPIELPDFSNDRILGEIYKPATPVYVLGYALFPPSTNIEASISFGSLAKTVQLPLSSNNKPILLQSSAAVHSGNSGGLLINANTGDFLGMVTSNVAHTLTNPNETQNYMLNQYYTIDNNNTNNNHDNHIGTNSNSNSNSSSNNNNNNNNSHMNILPHLNFSIPSVQLLPVFQFISSNPLNFNLLHELDNSCWMIEKVWKLQEFYPKQQPVLKFPTKYKNLLQTLDQHKEDGPKIDNLL